MKRDKKILKLAVFGVQVVAHLIDNRFRSDLLLSPEAGMRKPTVSMPKAYG